ncbi:MAG: glycosyltransferase [Bacteroidales bacterium]|nr:glycosyltransferase [Bacteroidales bacterium]
MIYDFWDEFFWYWYSNGFQKVFRIFWYFFLLEAPRFLLMDFVILIVYFRRRDVNRDAREKARREFMLENPIVSVIAPGKNEGKHIYKLVNSLNEQSYRNLQIVIVDDGSDDDTYLICKSLYDNGYIDVFIRNDDRGGKASAANLALRYATGKYVVHLDADSSFDANAIENIIIPFYMNKNLGAVGGNIKVRNYEKNICTSVQAIEYMQTITVGRMVTSYLGIYKIISGAFGAFRKDIIDRIGGWDIGPGLDGDITVKVRKLGYDIGFEHSAIGLTNVPEKWKILSKQRLRWNKSLIRFRMRKHKDIYSPSAAFNFSNFFALFENVFFNLVLDVIWFFYIINIIIVNVDFLAFIIPLKIMLYGTASLLQFIVVMIISERWRQEIKLIIFIPLMMIYNGYYMRIIRTMAYLKEIFFFSSYKDPWNPSKSSAKAREFGL